MLGYFERKTIEKTVFVDNSSFSSKLIPLNSEFDALMEDVLNKESVFGKIFGDEGLSSRNRQEKHIINCFQSELGENYRCFRHGILSSKLLDKGEIRTEESKNAATELLQAALLQELKAQGLSIDNLQDSEPIVLNLSSISLVTPDNIGRRFYKDESEKTMLEDQVEAYKALEKQTSLNIAGREIQVKIKIQTFNFGVNILAHKAPFAINESRQHRINVQAWNKLKSDIQDLKNVIGDQSEAMNLLEKDIDQLLKDKNSYIREALLHNSAHIALKWV